VKTGLEEAIYWLDYRGLKLAACQFILCGPLHDLILIIKCSLAQCQIILIQEIKNVFHHGPKQLKKV
jgi:hypothetical protein